jgi:hypothetical protein
MTSYGDSASLPFCYGSVFISMFKRDDKKHEAILIAEEGNVKVVDLYITYKEIEKIISTTTLNKLMCVSDNSIKEQDKLFVIVTDNEFEIIYIDVAMLSKNIKRFDFCKKKKNKPWFSIKVCRNEFCEMFAHDLP